MYWIVLIAGAILALIYVVVKIRHNQLATSDAVFWFLLALVLIVMALFPSLSISSQMHWASNHPPTLFFSACSPLSSSASSLFRWKMRDFATRSFS